MRNDLNECKPKIAVIAVHGVADQSAHDSARAIASLLLNHNQSEKPDQRENPTHKQVQYTPFTESTLRIAVRRVEMTAMPEQDGAPQQKLMDERGTYIHRCLHKPRYPSTEKLYPTNIEDCLDERAHGFMSDQLREYQGEGVGSTYETIKLEGSRLKGNKPQANVHIYEMYWADLSRLGTGFFRIFGEFYQLLFHLSSLGREAVDMARLEYQDTFGHKNLWWTWYSSMQAWAGRMLSIFIPILNLYLLLATPITLPGNIPPQYLPIIALSSLGIISAVLTGWWVFRRQQKTPLLMWIFLPIVVAGVVIGLGFGSIEGRFSPWLRIGYYRFLAVEWCLLSGLSMWLLIREYTRRRPGADRVALWLGVILGVLILGFIAFTQDSHQGITNAAFKIVEIIYLLLSFGWIAFFIFQFLAALCSWVAIRQRATRRFSVKDNGRNERAKRAVWTARITLAIPSALFIVVTLMLIGALERLGSRLLPKDDFYTPLFPWQFVTNYNHFSGAEFVHQLIIAAASPALVVILVGILLSLLVAVWSLIPSAWSEVCPPQSSDRISQQFGKWLTNGIQVIDGWGNVFVVIMAIVFPITYIACFLYPQLAAQTNLTEEIIGIGATILVASTTSLFAFRGRLDKLSLGFRNALDIILDVDNYLRVHPLDSNPRARICARYVSMFRYLCNWKDPEDGQGYDAILIVAHSQGTVITADLLRFLNRETDPTLERIIDRELPIYFFTMGCPLRQLYGLGFPHLYNWARQYGKPNSGKKCDSVAPEEWIPGNPPHIPENQKPDPTKLLGVRRWVNTFRSADYVGRYLWRSDSCSYQWLKPAKRNEQDPTWTSDRDRPVNFSEDENHTRQEFCLGAGAHTHYWDGTSDEVAAEIDFLIDEAYRECKKQVS